MLPNSFRTFFAIVLDGEVSIRSEAILSITICLNKIYLPLSTLQRITVRTLMGGSKFINFIDKKQQQYHLMTEQVYWYTLIIDFRVEFRE